ncbi:MAG: CBS domain-containing protein [Promethearchaeota archaeon]
MTLPSSLAEIMTPDPVTLSIPGSRDDLIEAIRKYKHRSFPIVKDDKLLGVAGRSELFKKTGETQLAVLLTRLNQGVSAVPPETTIKRAAQHFLKNRQGCLLVTENDRLVGIVTVSDIIGKVIANAEISGQIESYFSRDFTCIWEGTRCDIAGIILLNSGQNAIPILSDGAKITGIFGWHDLLQFAEERSTEHISSTTSSAEYKPGSWDSETVLVIGSKLLELPSLPLLSILSPKKLITAYESASIIDCAKKMKKHQISQIPVISADGTLKGLLTGNDLLQAYLELG